MNAAVPFFAGCGIGSSILYEDQRFLVIDKPANLLVHPTGPGRPDTLWDEEDPTLPLPSMQRGMPSIEIPLPDGLDSLPDIGAPAAVLNAINDALRDTQVCFGHIPVLPEDVHAALTREGAL